MKEKNYLGKELNLNLNKFYHSIYYIILMNKTVRFLIREKYKIEDERNYWRAKSIALQNNIPFTEIDEYEKFKEN